MSALNRDSIALMKECLCNLYNFKKPDDEISAGLKLALHERIAQLEMEELFSFEGCASCDGAVSFRPPPELAAPILSHGHLHVEACEAAMRQVSPPELLNTLKDSLRTLENITAVNPDEPQITMLKQNLRRRIAELEGATTH